MSFSQIHRLLTAKKLNDEEDWRKSRLIAYETWRKGGRNAPDINSYMPIGEIAEQEMTEEELDEIWKKYGKLRRN